MVSCRKDTLYSLYKVNLSLPQEVTYTCFQILVKIASFQLLIFVCEYRFY